MASMVVPGEEAATTTRRLTSTVWRGYTINRPADGGAPPTATCLKCGLTLCAGGNNGTSHLRRHSKSKRCLQQRAAGRERERERELCAATGSRSTSPTTAAAEPSPAGDDDDYCSQSPPAVVVEGEEKDRCFTVDGIYIPELYDKLIAEGLENIDQYFSAASNYVPAVAQAASSRTRWFINKTKERKRQKTRSDAHPMMNPASMSVHMQPEFNLRGKIEDVSLPRLPDLAPHGRWQAAGAADATIQDNSHHARNKQ